MTWDERANKFEILTKREKDIVDLVVQGFSNREIADRLFIDITTVKSHVTSILSKLNLRNRREIIIYFMSKKIPTIEG